MNGQRILSVYWISLESNLEGLILTQRLRKKKMARKNLSRLRKNWKEHLTVSNPSPISMKLCGHDHTHKITRVVQFRSSNCGVGKGVPEKRTLFIVPKQIFN